MRELIISETDIRKLCVRAGMRGQPYFRDSSFAPLRLEDVTVKLGGLLKAFYDQAGVVYKTEASDCDDFARYAAALAALVHGRGWGEGEASAAVALDEFHYVDARIAHAINIAVVGTSAADIRLGFFEPQVSDLDWVEYLSGHRLNQTPGLRAMREVELDLTKCEVLKCEF